MGKSKTKLFSLLTVAALSLSLVNPVTTQAEQQAIHLTDTQNHWASTQINKWVDSGLVRGYEDNTFKPNNQVTRAEFMAMVNKSFNFNTQTPIDFVDVPVRGTWYRVEVQKAVAAGYITGYEDKTMRPSASISRQEAAVIISKIAELNTPSNPDSAIASFNDKAAVADWSKRFVGAVVNAGVMQGYPDGTFQPNKSITRAEAVVTLNEVMPTESLEPTNPVKPNETIDSPGTYGSVDQIKTVTGTLTIDTPGVTLLNTVIDGDLIITEAVGEGEVTLDRVTVKGKTIIRGGGDNSVKVKDSVLHTATVNKENGKVRIATEGGTKIDTITLDSGASLEGSGFEQVVLSKNIPEDSQISFLAGTFKKVNVSAKDVELNVEKAATILKLILDARVDVVGEGTIEHADINVSSSTFENEPVKYDLGTNVTTKIAGETFGNRTSTGGGGGGGGSSSVITPAVSNLSLEGGTFIGSGTEQTIEINKSQVIKNLTFDLNVDSKLEIKKVVGKNNKTINLSRLMTPVQVKSGSGKTVNMISMTGLGNTGIPASTFAELAGYEDGTGTFTIDLSLTNRSQTKDYSLTVRVK